MYPTTLRTYKSKKDTVGALDHKDVLLCIDKKSSAFDAFYIQNIKQTKRELSCVSTYNQHGAVSKKVRKRKLVKRVVKDIEPSPEKLSSKSTFLTPDKSIRVNKALDPFDMLLNSSPSCRDETEPTSENLDLIQPKVGSKKYSRKKPVKGKKLHKYSSSEFSGSEKENSNNKNKIQDTTDIQSYELIVEKDSNRPKIFDGSVSSIINNLPCLNKQNLSPVFKTPIKYRRNRLTNSIHSPILKTSPLCSTPFKEKYRGQSIFRFSPIIGMSSKPNVSILVDKDINANVFPIEDEAMANINTTPVVLTEANESIKFDSKKYPTKVDFFKYCDNDSNVQELGDNNLIPKMREKLKTNNEITSNTLNIDKTEQEDPYKSLQTINSFANDSKNYSNLNETKICSIHNTENEPFMGFSRISDTDVLNHPCVLGNIIKVYNKNLVYDNEMGNYKNGSFVSIKNKTSIENNFSHYENVNDHRNNIAKNLESRILCISNNSMNCNEVNDHNTPSDDTSYDTCENDSEDHEIKKPVVLIKKLNDSIVFKYYNINIKSDKSHDSKNLTEKFSYSESNDSKPSSENNVSNLENNVSPDNANGHIHRLCEDDELYNNTIDEINYSYKSNESKFNATKYMNISRYSKLSHCDTDKETISSHESHVSDSKSSESISESNGSYTSQSNSSKDISESIESNLSYQLSINDNDTYIESDNDLKSFDENKCVNFVTTRRRNRANSSLYMSMYSNSAESNSLSISKECEKTVLSNKNSLEKDSCADNSFSRSSLNRAYNKNQGPLKTFNSNKCTKRSSIKARNLRKSRLSNTKNQSVISRESPESTDQTSYESEDDCSVTLYKIAPNNPVYNETLEIDDLSTINESVQSFGKVDVDVVDTTKVISDSDIITITETDSDDVNTNTTSDMLESKQSSVNKSDKSNISSVSESELKDKVSEIIVHSNKSRKTNTYRQFNDRKSGMTTRTSLKLLNDSNKMRSSKIFTMNDWETRQGIVLQPGKKWERSLSIYRRMSMMGDFDVSLLDEDCEKKGRKYRESVINTMEMQDCRASLHNESFNSRKSIFMSKRNHSNISIIKDPDNSKESLSSTSVFQELQAFSTPLFFNKALEAKCMHLSLQYTGFLNDECDDTIIELSKLSLADADHEVTVLGLHEKPERGSTAQDYVLRRCNQTDTILFDECYPDTALKNCHKIGEGVYGEVFLWRDRDGRARVMKIVPVAGSVKVNGEHQKDFQEIISEIVIAMELSALRSPIAAIDRHFEDGKEVDALDLHDLENATDVFNEVLAVRCVYGSYPSRLLDLWELYDECKGSENDNPAILPVDQQYIVLELANAGQDLESYQFNNAEQAHALFLQVAFGLAVGEEAYQFEHRDLHWGNVLIAPTDQKYASFVLRGRCHRVARCGVAATIIDYSLSRLSCPLGAGGDTAALYNDLATDDGLFDAVGDYQFEVYRLMRDKLGNDWKNFEPYTNILWLHYTVDKMITALRYKRVNTKIHKHYIGKLKGIKGRLLTYKSAVQFVLTDNEY
ncbi:hypothetical protein K1T71_001083 [Dendrolimus kikuchii]|uniref:Uncharacterized protein n=1 Tax=Dendrolimus kikuchii TaxID=765133 RepID=A0ACC1DGU3_9NEOP|nr:hypothetical protein K1T71_001083 [Dendrolimus kikuchii]